MTRTSRRLSARITTPASVAVELDRHVRVRRPRHRLGDQLAQAHLVRAPVGRRRRRTGRSRAGPRPAAGSGRRRPPSGRPPTAPRRRASRRGGRRAPRSTPTRVMSGERSSWLTSDAKRPSRSMRSSRAGAMWLNDVTSTPRSGSSSWRRGGCRAGRRRWPRRRGSTSDSGRRVRRLVHQPSAAPASVVDARRAEQRRRQRLERVLRSRRARRSRSRRRSRGAAGCRRRAGVRRRAEIRMRAGLPRVDQASKRLGKGVATELGHWRDPVSARVPFGRRRLTRSTGCDRSAPRGRSGPRTAPSSRCRR